MSAPVLLSSGAGGSVRAFDGENLQLELDRPLPPGTRVDGKVRGEVVIRGKVVQAKRTDVPDRFLVVLKLTDVSRDDRDKLLAEVGK